MQIGFKVHAEVGASSATASAHSSVFSVLCATGASRGHCATPLRHGPMQHGKTSPMLMALVPSMASSVLPTVAHNSDAAICDLTSFDNILVPHLVKRRTVPLDGRHCRCVVAEQRISSRGLDVAAREGVSDTPVCIFFCLVCALIRALRKLPGSEPQAMAASVKFIGTHISSSESYTS